LTANPGRHALGALRHPLLETLLPGSELLSHLFAEFEPLVGVPEELHRPLMDLGELERPVAAHE
jgi:hypothetical protein